MICTHKASFFFLFYLFASFCSILPISVHCFKNSHCTCDLICQIKVELTNCCLGGWRRYCCHQSTHKMRGIRRHCVTKVTNYYPKHWQKEPFSMRTLLTGLTAVKIMINERTDLRTKVVRKEVCFRVASSHT